MDPRYPPRIVRYLNEKSEFGGVFFFFWENTPLYLYMYTNLFFWMVGWSFLFISTTISGRLFVTTTRCHYLHSFQDHVSVVTQPD